MTNPTRFQAVIESLLEKHGLLEDFYSDSFGDVLVELSMEHFDDLTIRRTGHIISAGHYYVVKQNIAAGREVIKSKYPDPILDFVLQIDNVWVPFKSELQLATYHCAHFEEANGFPIITRVNQAMRRDIVEFTDIFAKNIEQQGWINAILKQVIRIDKSIPNFQAKAFSYDCLKKDIKSEILDAISNDILPHHSATIAKLCGKYERLWVLEYKGFRYVVGDPLDGFYSFVDMLEDFLEKELLTEKELLSNFTVHADTTNN